MRSSVSDGLIFFVPSLHFSQVRGASGRRPDRYGVSRKLTTGKKTQTVETTIGVSPDAVGPPGEFPTFREKLGLDDGVRADVAAFALEAVFSHEKVVEEFHERFDGLRRFDQHPAFEIAALHRLGTHAGAGEVG